MKLACTLRETWDLCICPRTKTRCQFGLCYTLTVLRNHPVVRGKLSDSITYDSTKQPIKLPKTHSMIDDDSLVKVLGWGIFELFGPVSDVLLHSTMRKINNQDCEEASGGDLLTNRMFCALSDTARPCVGDSGSPLIFQSTLFGVVSWSRSCDRQYPTAFTAIAELKDWITDVTSIS